MSWRYRVCRKKIDYSNSYRIGFPFEKTEEMAKYEYGIVEYYEGGGHTAFIDLYTDDELGNDPIKSLRWQLEHMLKALDEPVIDYEGTD